MSFNDMIENSTKPTLFNMNRWYVYECERLKQLNLPIKRLQFQHYHQMNEIDAEKFQHIHQLKQYYAKQNAYTKSLWNTCPIHHNNDNRRNLIHPFSTLLVPIELKCNCNENLWTDNMTPNNIRPVDFSPWSRPKYTVPIVSLRKQAQEDYRQYRLRLINKKPPPKPTTTVLTTPMKYRTFK
ncbi:unnamed protein product [Schistosoma turkestanicum]|nr:unnamed protein product [Schistosoma turkestanicum]